jgi:hypothetical protein
MNVMHAIDGKNIGSLQDFDLLQLPPQIKTFSFQTLAFFTFNLLTAGIYGARASFLKEKEFRQLESKKEVILLQTERIHSVWKALEEDLNQLKALHPAATSDQINELNEKGRRNFSQIDLRIADHSEESFNYCRYIAHIFFNCITLGIAGFYNNWECNRKAEKLHRELTHLVKDNHQSLQQRATIFNNHISFFNTVKPKIIQNNELRLTPNGKIHLLQQKNALYQSEIEALSLVIADETTKELALTSHVDEQRKSLKILKEQEGKVKKLLASVRTEKEQLTLRDKQKGKALKESLAKAEVAKKLATQVQDLNSELTKFAPLLYTQSLLGPIPRAYDKKEGDKIGARQVDKDFFALIENKNCAAEIVIASFDACFDLLLNDERVVLNKSSLIYLASEYENNKRAIYSFLAHHLIRLGEVVEEVGEFTLSLNKTVRLGYSKPTRILTKQLEFGKREPTEVLKIVYEYVDDFTVMDQNLPFGIDPISIKWLLNDLKEESQSILFTLLMAPLIPNDSLELMKANELMKVKSDEVTKIQMALGLLLDFSYALEKKFHNVLIPHWKNKANDASESIQPLKKAYLAEDGSSIVPFNKWEINTEYLSPELALAIGSAKAKQKLIFEEFSKEEVAFPLTTAYSAKLHTKDDVIGITHQYYKYHSVIEPHGCLFTALLALIVADKSKLNVKNVKELKIAICKCLNKEEIRRKYKKEIKSTHGVTVEQYQRWMMTGFSDTKKNIHNLEMGDLELKLVAEILNVRFGVFREGAPTKLDSNGLMIPGDETSYYGPHTKEVLMLYNEDKPWSYCALWPKFKGKAENPEVNQAHLYLKNYWETLEQAQGNY